MVMIAGYGPDAVVQLQSPADVERLLDDVRDAAADAECGILAAIWFSDRKSPLLHFGARGNVGVVEYGSADPPISVMSRGSDRTGTVRYTDGTHPHDYPASAEIPNDNVRKAVTEFYSTNGQQPTNIDWAQNG